MGSLSNVPRPLLNVKSIICAPPCPTIHMWGVITLPGAEVLEPILTKQWEIHPPYLVCFLVSESWGMV